MPTPESTVHPIHFEDYDPRDFERLVFAFLLRTGSWQTLDWYGQLGADLGRDIWGVRDGDGSRKQTFCVQCANRRRVPLAKVRHDIDCIALGPNGAPDRFILATGGAVSARLRDAVKTYAAQKQIQTCEIWTGPEFEERLHQGAESLLNRFVRGEPFPDAPSDIRALVESIAADTDEEIVALMAGLFDRPAFYTPFHHESSIPAFKKAITDTIEALNTGVHRLRDGTEIRRIPSRHQVKSSHLKESLAQIERTLCELRAQYDTFIKTRDVRPCGCNVPDCPVFMVSPQAARELDRLRMRVLNAFHVVYPPFRVRVGWDFDDR